MTKCKKIRSHIKKWQTGEWEGKSQEGTLRTLIRLKALRQLWLGPWQRTKEAKGCFDVAAREMKEVERERKRERERGREKRVRRQLEGTCHMLHAMPGHD